MTTVQGNQNSFVGGAIPSTIEATAVSLCIKFWVQCEAETARKMEGVKSLNAQMDKLNTLLAKLGRLDAAIAEPRGEKEFDDAKKKDPNLIYQINEAIVAAGFQEKIFRSIDGKSFDIGYTSAVNESAWSGVTGQFPTQTRAGALFIKNYATENAEFIKFLCARADPPITQDLSKLTMGDWERLAISQLDTASRDWTGFQPLHPDGDKPDRATSEAGWHFTNYLIMRYEFGQHWQGGRREFASGGLSSTNRSASSLYEAVQTVKNEISNISNTLQSESAGVSAAMQKTSGALAAVTELFSKFFSTMGKILSSI